MSLGVPLGLASGLCWGAADFFGGVQSRRLPALTVAFWSQLAGALALAAVLALQGRPPPAGAGMAWGLAAGAGSGCALVLFYRGLAEGTMSVVAPISACGAVVPVAAAILTGDRPGAIAGLGVLAAITGVVLVSHTRPRSPNPRSTREQRQGRDRGSARDQGQGRDRGSAQGLGQGLDRGPAREQGQGRDRGSAPELEDGRVGATRAGRVFAMALGAALGFGLFYVFVDAGTAASGSPWWVIAGARVSSLVMLSTIALAGRRSALRRSALRWPGRRRIGPVSLVGIGDTGANLLFAYAATAGNLAVVGVLGSLYPVATVVLARWLLDERLSGRQNAGVVLALTGVGLLAAG